MKFPQFITRKWILALGGVAGMMAAGVLWGLTLACRSPMPDSLSGLLAAVRKPQLVDRNGIPITVTYANTWNSSSYLPLYDIPEFLKTAFILSEDRRFYHHAGVDWMARIHALVQNAFSLDRVRGASTITEQVVRMIHPRPRTLWSRWLEGFDAMALETLHDKADILEFYMNQVPYAANRRGVAQASEYYFNRSLDTLNRMEMLALVVSVRAPSYFDLYKKPERIRKRIGRLADELREEGILCESDCCDIHSGFFELEPPGLAVRADHFARYVYSRLTPDPNGIPFKKIKTTLDGGLQARVDHLIREALEGLASQKVRNASCLVVDHRSRDVLAWVSLGTGDDETSGRHINGVLVPRQPGSSMKPFLYALALDRGWTAAQEILDSPLTNPVGRGLHTYHNYSRRHYGWVTLRTALGNSLNIPAVRAIRFVGYDRYLERLHDLGFDHLDKHPDFYGDGLALGCGEVSLYHMVQAYAALADGGRFRPLCVKRREGTKGDERRIFSAEAVSLIGNILSDPGARTLEFGHGGLLNFPVQTAVKTGTSSDYRDAWAFGYNHGYVVGVWMGNFDGRPMNGITGSTGPAMVLRTIFAELNKREKTRPLVMSPDLVRRDVCVRQGMDGSNHVSIKEWFINGTCPQPEEKNDSNPFTGFLKPVNGLEMAMDPRIPDTNEAFLFLLDGVTEQDRTVWAIDGRKLGETYGGRYLWLLQKGTHVLDAAVYKSGEKVPVNDTVVFTVK